jgi:hypothetical protein
MRYLVFFLWLSAITAMAGCHSASPQGSASNDQAAASLVPPDQPECSDQSSILVDQLGELREQMEGTFPYVYQGAGRSNILEAYTMRFVLCYSQSLQPLTNDKVNWIQPDQYSELNGNLITYLRTGREISLTSPYISVQWIAKSLPGCSTVDSMYMFWDNYYLKDTALNKVLMPVQPVKTISGQTAYCKEYQTQPKQIKVSPKRIAYGYIDYDESYYLGFALTTSAATDWELNRPLFYQLIRSFSYL